MQSYTEQSHFRQPSRAMAVQPSSPGGISMPAVQPFQRMVSPASMSGVVQLGKKKTKKNTGDNEPEPKKEKKVEVDSDEEVLPTTPQDLLVSVLGIDETEAQEILAKTVMYSELAAKNADGIKFLAGDKGRQKRAELELNERGLQKARDTVIRFNILQERLNLDDDLAHFATHTAAETSSYSNEDMEGFGKTYNDDEEQWEDDPEFDKDAFVAALEREQEDFHANRSKGGGGGSGDWAFGSVRNEAKEIGRSGDQQLFKNGKYTIHHKVSRSNLKGLHKKMVQHADVSQSFKLKLEEIGTSTFKGASNTQKILLNLPFNLEVGPSGDNRIGDPGSGVDLNTDEDGARTPRSEVLNEIDNAIGNETQMNQQQFWDALTTKLETLRKLQKSQLKSDGREDNVLSKPKVDQWEPQQGGKFRRR